MTCCHYDEGYDEGYDAGKSEANEMPDLFKIGVCLRLFAGGLDLRMDDRAEWARELAGEIEHSSWLARAIEKEEVRAANEVKAFAESKKAAA